MKTPLLSLTIDKISYSPVDSYYNQNSASINISVNNKSHNKRPKSTVIFLHVLHGP